ncbi:MAG: ABC transporter permease subunit [Rhizobiaceae bacterium]|nr:ABC transporter permease subunit [Rhizobiaceae bacterium]MDF2372523.1 ABC transporter permease subunit [Rhizobiaceae bacterium]|tara:strand:+ start:30038 stop:30946 length:909 start_codon:yes stop_codon:yes gene_type:complete
MKNPKPPELARHRRERLWMMLQLLPVFSVLTILFGGALVLAVLQSLGFAPWFGVNTFPDFSYFGALWGSYSFWQSLALTLYYALMATFISLVMGVLLALAMVRMFPGKSLYKYLYKLPLMIPYTVGIALAVIMLGNGGMLSRLAAFAGLISDPSEFPQILKTHYGWGIIAVYVWKQAPFVTLTIYAVLLGVGRETEEAATILGASRWQTFFQVTLPQILPGIVSSTLIIFAFNIGAFEAPFILGGGYPDTLPVVAWRYFNDADYTLQLQGMATVVSIALIASGILFTYLALYRRYERRIGRN